MARFIARRLLLAIVTLWLLATIVFVIANVLPDRRRPDDPRAVRAAGERRRAQPAARDRPSDPGPLRRVASKGIVTLDFGDSFVSGQPVLPQLLGAVGRSAKLAGLALLITIPISIARRPVRRQTQGPQGRSGDRPARASRSSSIPEFVTGTILVVVVGVQLGWLPVVATAPPERRHRDADPLPADARDRDGDRLLRVHRADDARRGDRGPPVRLHAHGDDEGPDRRRRRCAATSCATRCVPTVAVIAVQIGYLFGGIIAVEKIFNYNGMGATMLFAAQNKDLPMLTAGVLIIGIVYMLATLAADLIMAWMNPRIRLDAEQLMATSSSTPAPTGTDGRARRHRSGPRPAARRSGSWSSARRSSSATSSSSVGSSAPSSDNASRHTIRSTASPPATCHPAPSIGWARTGLAATSCRESWSESRDVLIVAPLAALLGVTAGHFFSAFVMGYYRGPTR